ncbi:MAG: hypothetical protein KUG77_29650 [Nannocystaceae bacterium]|nr:hypothetical protein [Nannocystaceae bacterium]
MELSSSEFELDELDELDELAGSALGAGPVVVGVGSPKVLVDPDIMSPSVSAPEAFSFGTVGEKHPLKTPIAKTSTLRIA